MTWSGPLPKPSRTERKKAEASRRRERRSSEDKAKAAVRRRDKRCRFPLCGCQRLRLALEARGEVSHDRHKGMGGNPAGDRSTPADLVLLCAHRHQHGAISVHKGTLRRRFLTAKKFNGPIAWMVNQKALYGEWAPGPQWFEVARERAIGVWEPFAILQEDMLEELARMAS